MNEQAIILEAFAAAKESASAFIAEHGEPWYCGFAWVKIRPGNSKIAKLLKQSGAASKSYTGGVDVWNPSGHPTQSMDVKEAGAVAFARVLQKYGINAYAQSRAD